MACDKCEVRASLDGRSVHVRLIWTELEEKGKNIDRAGILYQCNSCGTFWESCGYEPSARELSKEEAAEIYFLKA
jgi:hypothetical protein